jgi:hypothetical protein
MRWIWCIVVYLLAMIGIVVLMTRARDRAVTQLATPESMANWNKWRTDVREQQDQPGPVQRRVPKSAEPPALVMMRDHFAVSLFGALFFSTLLFWFFAWFMMGILRSSKTRTAPSS